MSLSQAAPRLDPDQDFFERRLSQLDPEIAAAIRGEIGREQRQIELIASENFASPAVLEAQGSVLTNKYAEGYPGRRYYGGCEFMDVAEQLAIDRARRLFGCAYANVQPHSGASANLAVFLASAAARRHHPGHVARRRRPSDPWRAAQHLGQVVRGDRLRRAPAGPADRLRRGAGAGRAPSPQADHRRRLGLSAGPRFRAVSGDRRCGRRLSDGRHGAHRGPGRGGRASEPVPARPHRHQHHPQDPARAARRPDPGRRPGARQEAELGDVPGPPGRPADARDRGQGGRVRGSPAPRLQDLRAPGGRERQGARRGDGRGRPGPGRPAAPTIISSWSICGPSG